MNLDEAPNPLECASRAARLHSLLELTQRIVEQRTLPELLEELAPRLNAVSGTDTIALTLQEPGAAAVKAHVLASGALATERRCAAGYAIPFDETPGGEVFRKQQPIERSVILTKGNVLNVSLSELTPAPAPIIQRAPNKTPAGTGGDRAVPNSPLLVVDETERALITKALEECGWRVGGAKGAAAKLGVSRTTLQSKMERLGIARPG